MVPGVSRLWTASRLTIKSDPISHGRSSFLRRIPTSIRINVCVDGEFSRIGFSIFDIVFRDTLGAINFIVHRLN